MSRHLKNIVISRLASTIATFVDLPANASPHTKGVRYFRANVGIKCLWGAMNSLKEGQQRRKHIIVRPSRFRDGLFELYTYHFPTHWSAACVANRELIKEAQRQAHALERDHSMETLEWRVRFLTHYFNVFKAHKKPEPGLKPYSRFYQYTYVAIYRALQAARDAQLKAQADKEMESSLGAEHDNASLTPADISFEPIEINRLRSFARRRQAFSRVFLGSMMPLLE